MRNGSITMTETNKKEMLAGLFLSKFCKAGLDRLGYKTYEAAYTGLSNLVGGNRLSVRNYRDEFDSSFPENGRIGYLRKMMPSRKAMLDEYGGLSLEDMAQLVESVYLESEKFAEKLDEAFNATTDGVQVSDKANKVADATELVVGDINPESVEGRDRVASMKVRLGQAQFRKWILSIYGGKCCVSGLSVPDILRASHIVAWSNDKENRMNPSNGLCLSATYDAAFDRHLISFDEDFRMILSEALRDYCTNEVHKKYFLDFEGEPLQLPVRFLPSQELLSRHRERLVG